MSWRKVGSLGPQSRRCFASLPAKGKMESQVSKISAVDNGFIVGSIENYAPVSHVIVAVGAGPRHEKAHEKGVAHAIRTLSNLSTTDATQFAISRVLDAGGSNLITTTTREETIFHLQTTRDHLEKGMSVLGQVTTRQAFKPWEVERGQSQIKMDLAYLDRDKGAKLSELVHEAAFRQTPLSRSLYCNPNNVSRILNGMLLDFVEDHFTVDRMAILGIGVDHEDLLDDVSRYFDASRSKPATPVASLPSKFHGGSDLRQDDGGNTVVAALVASAATKNAPEAAAFKVLAKILGGEPHSKYSSNLASSRLNAAISNAAPGGSINAAFEANYSDGGLFGFSVATSASSVGDALKAGAAEVARLAAGDFTDEDVERGIRQAKAEAFMHAESVGEVGKSLAIELLHTKEVHDPLAPALAINGVTKESLVAAARALDPKKENFSLAAIGGTSSVPYVDEIFVG